MKLGIVGLTNTGKSTLFNALTSAGAVSANYAFSTMESNVGVVNVPDYRLDKLDELYKPDKKTPATLEFVDIAGLVKGSSKGEGLGNKFLGDIREVDAIVHVVRCFEDELVIHSDGSINAGRDIETINLELIFSDIEILERRLERARKNLKGKSGTAAAEVSLLEKLIDFMSEGQTARAFDMSDDDKLLLADAPLLSAKPVIYAANLSDKDFADYENNPQYITVREIAEAEHCAVFPICAKTEAEISDMDEADKQLFLDDLGVTESGLARIIKAGYDLLGLISFLTAGPKEVRAWTIKKGTKAPAAAGKIHTDLQRGFIKAEVTAFADVEACGSAAAAKEKGLLRIEGKEYIIKDGDVVLFRFNV